MSHSKHKTLVDWLSYLEQLHPKDIELELDRLYQVALRLQLIDPTSSVDHPFSGPLKSKSTVITVAGTNGKGSCIAALEGCLLASGATVASYTSPHLHHYCERVRINGNPVNEDLMCSAFEAIEQQRANISLTYFEFGTLAALWIFVQYQIPYILLEVGLGGRLDAVNVVDTDIAVITSIDIDHQAWLGNDRDTISREKLGIARSNRPLVIAEPDLTENLQAAVERFPVTLVNREYSYSVIDQTRWQFRYGQRNHLLPLPILPLASVAAAICVIQLLPLDLPATRLSSILLDLKLPGRFEQQNIDDINVIFDVAHNPAAAEYLAQRLRDQSVKGKTLGVFGALKDKDINGLISALAGVIDDWYIGSLAGTPRAAETSEIAIEFTGRNQSAHIEKSIEAAFKAAMVASHRHDRIVVFGSFYTVAAIQTLVFGK